MTFSTTDALMEEYRTLRAEILQMLEARRKRTTFAIAFVAGVLSFALSESQPVASVVAWLAGMAFWRIQRSEDRAVIRLSVYIATHIESKVPGLQWETWGTSVKAANSQPRVTSLPVLGHMVWLISPYAIMSLSCTLVGIAGGMAKWYPGNPFVIGGLSVVAVILHNLAFGLQASPLPKDPREEWRKAYAHIPPVLDASASGAVQATS